ncbi:hypothetical protein [Bradyrhizobium sp. JR3.5]
MVLDSPLVAAIESNVEQVFVPADAGQAGVEGRERIGFNMNRVANNVAEDGAAFDRNLTASEKLGVRSRLSPSRVGEHLNVRRVNRLHPKLGGSGCAV